MTFKELLQEKKVTGYALAKNTGIPYTTINDLINGRTIVQNISLKYALLIADYLRIGIRSLNRLTTASPIEFRYFRNNLLHKLKSEGAATIIEEIIKGKDIDYYYKNNSKEYAYYLLALIDYLCRMNNCPIYSKRYNDLRKEKLNKPFFVGSDLIHFDSIEEAEKNLNIEVIPEFKNFNIIEENVFNVA